MSARARIVADAIRRAGARSAERDRRGTARATVLSWTPLLLDLHGADLQLDDDDVEIGQDVRRYHASEGIQAGDVLVVTEVDEGDWIATSVVSGTAVKPVHEH